MPEAFQNPRVFPDGTLCYPKKGLPPPEMEGYRRKSNNPRSYECWMFIPLWQDCCFRQLTLVRQEEGCRCTKAVMICGDKENTASLNPLTLGVCQACFAAKECRIALDICTVPLPLDSLIEHRDDSITLCQNDGKEP